MKRLLHNKTAVAAAIVGVAVACGVAAIFVEANADSTAGAAVPSKAEQAQAASQAASQTAETNAVSNAVRSVIPEATVELAPRQSEASAEAVGAESGAVVHIAVPASSVIEPGSEQGPSFAVNSSSSFPDNMYEAGETGFRAELAVASVASREPNVVGWKAEISGASASANAQNSLHSSVRAEPGGEIWGSGRYTNLEKTSPELATRQLESNIATAESAIGPATFEATRVVVVPIAGANNAFGIEADLRVHKLSELASNLGDITQGLQVGLVGDNTATVEGLAVNIVDDSGRRADLWMNARGGLGYSASDPTLNLYSAPSQSADVQFADITGGPPLSTMVVGTPATGKEMPHTLPAVAHLAASRHKSVRFAVPFNYRDKRLDVSDGRAIVRFGQVPVGMHGVVLILTPQGKKLGQATIAISAGTTGAVSVPVDGQLLAKSSRAGSVKAELVVKGAPGTATLLSSKESVRLRLGS